VFSNVLGMLMSDLDFNCFRVGKINSMVPSPLSVLAFWGLKIYPTAIVDY
jgi:hypothetical protein